MVPKVKTTSSTNAAVSVWTATGTPPEKSQDASGYYIFSFPSTVEILQAFGRYECNELSVDARSLLANRANLLKAIKGGGK